MAQFTASFDHAGAGADGSGFDTISSGESIRPTLIRTGKPQPVSEGAARKWAASAVVSGCLYLLLIAGFLGISAYLPDGGANAPRPQFSDWLTGSMGVEALLYLTLPFAFIAAGAAALLRPQWGRQALVVVSLIAIVVVCGGWLLIYSLVTSPQMAASLSGTSALQLGPFQSPEQQYDLVFSSLYVFLGLMGIWTTLQVAYCGLLCRASLDRR